MKKLALVEALGDNEKLILVGGYDYDISNGMRLKIAQAVIDHLFDSKPEHSWITHLDHPPKPEYCEVSDVVMMDFGNRKSFGWFCFKSKNWYEFIPNPSNVDGVVSFAYDRLGLMTDKDFKYAIL